MTATTATARRSDVVRVDVLDLVEHVPVAGRDWICPDEVALRLDRHGRPRQVLVPGPAGAGPAHRPVSAVLQVLVGTSAVAAAQQALVRPAALRDVPVVVVDTRGRALGVVAVARLVAAAVPTATPAHDPLPLPRAA